MLHDDRLKLSVSTLNLDSFDKKMLTGTMSNIVKLSPCMESESLKYKTQTPDWQFRAYSE